MNKVNHYRNICGIIGGLGPAATSHLFTLIVNLQITKKDQDHIPLLIFNNPQIPDRTKHLVYNKESPLPELIRTAKVLKSAGASFLAIPCNTAQAYIIDIEKEVEIKIINMIKLTAQHIINSFGKDPIVGLLATDGTILSRIYEKELNGVKIIIPDAAGQKNVMEAIYGNQGIKASFINDKNSQLLHREANKLIQRGANVIIEACTEIPLVLSQNECNFPIVDPLEILAKKILEITLDGKV